MGVQLKKNKGFVWGRRAKTPKDGFEFEQNAQGWKPPQWIIKEMDKDTDKQADNWKATGIVDLGEAHAFALAVQLNAGWLLTDDARARPFWMVFRQRSARASPC